MAAVEYLLASSIPRTRTTRQPYSTTPTATIFAGQARADIALTYKSVNFASQGPSQGCPRYWILFLILGRFCYIPMILSCRDRGLTACNETCGSSQFPPYLHSRTSQYFGSASDAASATRLVAKRNFDTLVPSAFRAMVA